jgi:hypothetical protein
MILIMRGVLLEVVKTTTLPSFLEQSMSYHFSNASLHCVIHKARSSIGSQGKKRPLNTTIAYLYGKPCQTYMDFILDHYKSGIKVS